MFQKELIISFDKTCFEINKPDMRYSKIKHFDIKPYMRLI